uniref:Uncharacterized protein n=1 Tax=Castor canadensis TaxID=51338 RepID=A0A8C0WE98_CASCN
HALAWQIGATVLLLVRRPCPPSTSTTIKDCLIVSFQSLSPREREAFKKAKDALVSHLSPSHPPSPALLHHAGSLILTYLRLLAIFPHLLPCLFFHTSPQLALTLNILENVPLHTLHHIHSQLQSCVSAGPHSRRLSHWLHHLQEAVEKESTGCLQASVTFNLFRLLTGDLNCVTSGDLCLMVHIHALLQAQT